MRRLGMSRPGRPGPVMLDIPPPHLSTGGSSSLFRALVALCPGVDYDGLMGLTGMAFRLDVVQRLDPRAAEDRLLANLPAMLEGLGARVEVLRPGSAEELAGIVRESVAAGIPLPIRGWPEGGLDWALVVGHDDARGVLCGWPATWTGAACAGAPPTGDAVLRMSEPCPPISPAEHWREAIGAAAGGEQALKAAYAQWSEQLSSLPLDAGDESWSLAQNHAAVAETLADARTSAAAFLSRCADLSDPTAAEWLEQARYAYEELADVVDAAPGLDRESVDRSIDAAYRDRWLEALARAEHLDCRAIGCLRRALTSTLSPSEIADEPENPANWT